MSEDREVICELMIDLPPVGKGRPKFGRGKAGQVTVRTPQETKDYETAVAQLMSRAVPSVNESDDLFVHAHFHLRTRRRKDIDNLVKALLDAGNGVIWHDDAQVIELVVYLERGAPYDGTELVVGIAAARDAPARRPAAGKAKRRSTKLPEGYDLCACGKAAKRQDVASCRACMTRSHS